jgi:hypothetical protein
LNRVKSRMVEMIGRVNKSRRVFAWGFGRERNQRLDDRFSFVSCVENPDRFVIVMRGAAQFSCNLNLSADGWIPAAVLPSAGVEFGNDTLVGTRERLLSAERSLPWKWNAVLDQDYWFRLIRRQASVSNTKLTGKMPCLTAAEFFFEYVICTP